MNGWSIVWFVVGACLVGLLLGLIKSAGRDDPEWPPDN